MSTHPPTSTKPPITLGQNTHLDPGAYARGTHAITLGENILVHPRAQLIAIHGPLSISDKCIILEKCIIGGPIPATSSTTDKPSAGESNPPTPLLGQEADDEEPDPVKTTIGRNVFIHASAHVHAGATIGDSVLIEAHVTVLSNVTVKAHAKICAGIIVDRDLDEWAVLYGNGNVKRQRMTQPGRNGGTNDSAELVETLRLKAMDKEREGTVALLRVAAKVAAVARKK